MLHFNTKIASWKLKCSWNCTNAYGVELNVKIDRLILIKLNAAIKLKKKKKTFSRVVYGVPQRVLFFIFKRARFLLIFFMVIRNKTAHHKLYMKIFFRGFFFSVLKSCTSYSTRDSRFFHSLFRFTIRKRTRYRFKQQTKIDCQRRTSKKKMRVSFVENLIWIFFLYAISSWILLH